jgi:hypothetical protein
MGCGMNVYEKEWMKEIQIPEGSKDLCWLVNERERERELC